jgi:membrane-associated phospholipid phosphatase
MTKTWLVAVAILSVATPALAQSPEAPRATCNANTSVRDIFTGTLHGFRQLGDRDSLGILAVGAAAALGAHQVDSDVTRKFPSSSLDSPFKSGALLGGTPFELGGAFGTYLIGRAFEKPCVVSLGADLVKAELMAEVLTMAVKQATHRSRPEGSGYSFPSGHTTVAFASATVLERHFGWKVGIPAYAVATYVAASRVEMKRHYLSDVAFGAALGIVAGRSVSVGHGRRLMVTPMASPDGAGAGFTWVGKK